eukprot:GHVU01177704.1.p2 GENE.GHVU01177704.1~~GHVU01177704.1.p2  ORF type:complete len:115 (-),score=15.33 GHVU01177704.1:12-356(-)
MVDTCMTREGKRRRIEPPVTSLNALEFWPRLIWADICNFLAIDESGAACISMHLLQQFAQQRPTSDYDALLQLLVQYIDTLLDDRCTALPQLKKRINLVALAMFREEEGDWRLH